MVKGSASQLSVVALLLQHGAEANQACSAYAWKAGTQTGTDGCGAHATASWGNYQKGTDGTQLAQTCAAAACTSATAGDIDKCCSATCGMVTFKAGAGTDVAASGTTKADIYCGADKVLVANQATTSIATGKATRATPTTADIPTCCQDACKTATVTFVGGAGTDAGTNFYCGADNIPIANQATTPSGIATNAGATAQKTTCCNAACGAATFTAGKGTDVAAAGTTKAKFYCGLNRVPVASQAAKDSGVDTVTATQHTTCCDDACGKVTFKSGKGTDTTTDFYCGDGRVPVANQATTPSGSDSVGAGEASTCCDDACGKVTFKAGKGTDDSTGKTYYCGENKVPVAKQAEVPSGSDSIGSGEKSTCCAAACSTVTYKAGEGTDATPTFFCGKDKAPKMDQKTLPCDGFSSCSSAGKSHCCAATCASTKWASGKKPTSPASGTMYCGDGMSPKAALADTVCAGDDCSESVDAATCCEKPKVNNSSATTDAHTAGLSIFILSAATLSLAIQV